MDTKLTLKLDAEVIEKAKKYAASQHKSLSRMIESYLRALVQNQPTSQVEEPEITPYVKSLKTGVSIPDDLDEKQAYRESQLNKHR